MKISDWIIWFLCLVMVYSIYFLFIFPQEIYSKWREEKQ